MRIETLLWGGDELIWVVPAWLGWNALCLFYQQAKTHIKFRGGTLKHAAGLVFCHHNAPIHRVKSLAHDLAELAKEQNRDSNLIAYQVLKSFDHVGMDLDGYRGKMTKGITTPHGLLVAAENMQEIDKQVRILKCKDLPKRKVYQIVEELRNNHDKKVKDYIRKLRELKFHRFFSSPPKNNCAYIQFGTKNVFNLCANYNGKRWKFYL